MAQPVEFDGVNSRLGPPKGMDELEVQTLPVFSNGQVCISCWELSDEELAYVIATRRVYLSVMFGSTQPPCFVGSEQTVRDVNSDTPLWKRGK